MSKKESNPPPPDRSKRPPPPPPPPPPGRHIKEGVQPPKPPTPPRTRIICEDIIAPKTLEEPEIVITGDHIPPKYYGYTEFRENGYTETTKCRKCETIGMIEDCYSGSPCKYCGGTVTTNGPAKWVPPVYAGFLWWKRLVVRGYWNPSK